MASSEKKGRFGMDSRTRRILEKSGQDAMQEINLKIREILEQAPSDAVAELEVHQDRNGFNALLKIVSQKRKFIGGSRGERFSQVIEQIFDEVWMQIDKWRQERTLDLEANEK